ncbi:hypothetical protein HYZ05_03040 [Candidatus Daviesbacteria bacterium]|nr:hypothetical protein [Candidatus Daviesbacteria bacterium]
MLFQLIISLIPICLAGFFLIRVATSIRRFELIIPAAVICGISVFVFLLNISAFIFKSPANIFIAYLLLILLSVFLWKNSKNDLTIDFFNKKELVFYIITFIFWALLIFWKANFALIGSDTNLYYAIAHTFLKGNFPLQTPWQPDVPLSYHTGASMLLAAFYFFTGLNFQFLHLFFSAIFIFCSIQIIIWLIIRHHSVISLLLANLLAATIFISFGFFYIVWPILPIQLPNLNSLSQLVLWFRELPTVSQSIEVYGAPINLDGLIYFIFHAFGLVSFLSLLLLLIYFKQGTFGGWLIICLNLAALAIVNESIFVAAFPAIVLGMLIIEYREGSLFKNLKKILIVLSLTVLVVFYQGGIITVSLTQSADMEKSAVIFPKKADIKDDFSGYHIGQEKSKLLPPKQEWLPLRWFHPGVDLLLIISLIFVIKLKVDFNQRLLLLTLFIGGLSSLIAYNYIVPKFLIANGNRFLSLSFLLLSLMIGFAVIFFYEFSFKYKKFFFMLIFLWIVLPTILPPLASLSKTRFGENKLIPKAFESSPGILWLKDNADLSENVMVLDKHAPHPSGQARAMVEAGVFAPVFAGNFRAFTIEASPQYLDIAYFLSPGALADLKISLLMIDASFYKSLPEVRKIQLGNKKYFEQVFDNSADFSDWERIYRIKQDYLKEAPEIDGIFKQLVMMVPKKGRVYIDNEENFDPSFLRRAIIFSLRDRELYFLPQSGVYLNVEQEINQKNPNKDTEYDFLVLGRNNRPDKVCDCSAKLIWKGLKDEVFIWKTDPNI